jgi:lipopolysaccharide export system protein LptA
MMRVFLIVLAILMSAPVFAEEVKITADSFTIAENRQQAEFKGNVVLVQPKLRVTSDQMIIYYGKGAGDIKQVDANGRVHLVTPDQDVTGDKGVYDPKSRTMRVTGNVVVINEQGRVTGPELLVNLATNTTEFITRGGGRVTGVFNP